MKMKKKILSCLYCRSPDKLWHQRHGGHGKMGSAVLYLKADQADYLQYSQFTKRYCGKSD